MNWLYLSENGKNFVARMIVFFWIFALVASAAWIVHFALVVDVNAFLGLSGDSIVGAEAIREIKLILIMIAISIFGGTIFIIKDFYRSIKNVTLFERTYEDYMEGILSFEEFQQIITLDVYTRRFESSWIYWFFMQPILSTIVGMIAFFIARSGLGFLQGASFEANISIQTFYVYGVFTFLAGFSSHKVLTWLDSLADKVFAIPAGDKKEVIKATVKRISAQETNKLKEQINSSTNTSEEDSEPMGDALKNAKDLKKIR